MQNYANKWKTIFYQLLFIVKQSISSKIKRIWISIQHIDDTVCALNKKNRRTRVYICGRTRTKKITDEITQTDKSLIIPPMWKKGVDM
jgi:hypothetical protein